MIILKDTKERSRFLKFAVVGAIGFCVDVLVYNFVRSTFGVMAELSSVISFCAAVFSNFSLNRVWTYPDSRSKPIGGQLIQFAVVNVIGLVIRTVIFSLIKDPLVTMFEVIHRGTYLGFSAREVGENLSLAIVVVIVMFWNFFINRYWTYNDIE